MAKTKRDAVIKTYGVMSPLRYGDDRYEPGQLIDMDVSEAEELVKAGVLVAPREAPAAAE